MHEGYSIVPRHRGGKEAIVPQLTSLIDVMTILLVFLMKSFSAEGNLVTPAQDLTLPLSSAQARPRTVTSVMVTDSTVLVDRHMVAIFGPSTGDSLLVEPLYRHLTSTKGEDDRMMIQADRDLPFERVKRVMYTCSKAGYEDFSVLVIQEEG
jgi:biopolymer transport protein ExbD